MAEMINTGTMSKIKLLWGRLGILAYEWRTVSSRNQNAGHIIAEYHQVFARLWQLGWRGDDLFIDQELPERLMPDYYVEFMRQHSLTVIEKLRKRWKKEYPNETQTSLLHYELVTLFLRQQADLLLMQPKWIQRYAQILSNWQTQDPLRRSETLIPGEIVMEIFDTLESRFDFYSSQDGKTLYATAKGRQLVHSELNANYELVETEIKDTIQLLPKQAILMYGGDALWLAATYGRYQHEKKEDS